MNNETISNKIAQQKGELNYKYFTININCCYTIILKTCCLSETDNFGSPRLPRMSLLSVINSISSKLTFCLLYTISCSIGLID